MLPLYTRTPRSHYSRPQSRALKVILGLVRVSIIQRNLWDTISWIACFFCMQLLHPFSLGKVYLYRAEKNPAGQKEQ